MTLGNRAHCYWVQSALHPQRKPKVTKTSGEELYIQKKIIGTLSFNSWPRSICDPSNPDKTKYRQRPCIKPQFLWGKHWAACPWFWRPSLEGEAHRHLVRLTPQQGSCNLTAGHHTCSCPSNTSASIIKPQNASSPSPPPQNEALLLIPEWSLH